MSKYNEREAREICAKYDIMKVLRRLDGENSVDCGFETEISNDCARRQGRETSGGFIVPDCVLSTATRVFDTTSGGQLIPTVNREEWLGTLLAKSVLGKVGVQTVEGCVGHLKFPRGGAVSPVWVGSEGDNAANVTPTFNAVSATPKRLGCYMDVTETMKVQTSATAQAYVLNTIAKSVALGVEKAAFCGAGNSGQPCGIENLTGVNSVSITAGAPTRAEIVNMWAACAAENADGEDGAFAYICPSAVKAKLLTTSDGHGSYLYQQGQLCDTAPLFDTNNVTAKKIVAGDWSKMLVAAWSGVELIRDPHSLSRSGGVRVVALMDCDIVVLEPKAFAIGTVLS